MNAEPLFKSAAKCRRLAASMPQQSDSAVQHLLRLAEDFEAQANAALDAVEVTGAGELRY
jgi:hypothetical protein